MTVSSKYIACTDVHYCDKKGIAACLLIEQWEDSEPVLERIELIRSPAPYEPGRFYLRELPCLNRVLLPVISVVSVVVIDGHVWLDSENKVPGLGARLYALLGERIPVIGVAKSQYSGTTSSVPVMRGTSKRPLLVGSAGISNEVAASCIRRMHGRHRIPTLLKRVDRLARNACRSG
jgi:deoxyribonuclease V